jgi:hypothetical protein
VLANICTLCLPITNSTFSRSSVSRCTLFIIKNRTHLIASVFWYGPVQFSGTTHSGKEQEVKLPSKVERRHSYCLPSSIFNFPINVSRTYEFAVTSRGQCTVDLMYDRTRGLEPSDIGILDRNMAIQKDELSNIRLPVTVPMSLK